MDQGTVWSEAMRWNSNRTASEGARAIAANVLDAFIGNRDLAHRHAALRQPTVERAR